MYIQTYLYQIYALYTYIYLKRTCDTYLLHLYYRYIYPIYFGMHYIYIYYTFTHYKEELRHVSSEPWRFRHEQLPFTEDLRCIFNIYLPHIQLLYINYICDIYSPYREASATRNCHIKGAVLLRGKKNSKSPPQYIYFKICL